MREVRLRRKGQTFAPFTVFCTRRPAPHSEFRSPDLGNIQWLAVGACQWVQGCSGSGCRTIRAPQRVFPLTCKLSRTGVVLFRLPQAYRNIQLIHRVPHLGCQEWGWFRACSAVQVKVSSRPRAPSSRYPGSITPPGDPAAPDPQERQRLRPIKSWCVIRPRSAFIAKPEPTG